MGKTAVGESVLERLEAARLYVVTAGDAGDYASMVEAACRGGADIIQFRDKQQSGRQRFETARRLRAICAGQGALFIVNDALEVALAVEADGVHLGQEDLPIRTARRIVNQMGVKEFLIGASTHSLGQALAAEQEGADYIALGPIFSTPTKPAYQPVGLELIRQVSSAIRVPWVVIGGIDASNVNQVLAAGARRVAVVRAVCGAPDITRAAQELKKILW